MSGYKYLPLEDSQLKPALDLIREVFLEFEAPDYPEQGIRTFLDYIDFNSIREKIAGNELHMRVCMDGDTIAGVIAMRNVSHISMLFVDRRYHGRGIGRGLFNTARDVILSLRDIEFFTVNSSPYAVHFYRRLGFVEVDTEQMIDGILFTPMRLLVRMPGPGSGAQVIK